MSRQLNANVRKIIQARKQQKERIEQHDEQMADMKETLQKQQQPLVDASMKNIKAIEHLIQQQQLQNQPQALPAPLQPQPQPQPQSPGNEEAIKLVENPWVQNFYVDHRGTGRRTSLEIDNKGHIGDHGKIHMGKLFNDNKIFFSSPSKDLLIRQPSKGLITLLTIPYDQIKKHRLPVTERDQKMYTSIMNHSGILPQSLNTKKFKTYIKPNLDEYRFHRPEDLDEETEEEEFEDAIMDTPKPKRYVPRGETLSQVTSSLEKIKLGKGLELYRNPQDLEHKLKLYIGSYRAGNTSSSIKNNIKSVLNEMLKISHITPKMHEDFYRKFLLF